MWHLFPPLCSNPATGDIRTAVWTHRRLSGALRCLQTLFLIFLLLENSQLLLYTLSLMPHWIPIIFHSSTITKQVPHSPPSTNKVHTYTRTHICSNVDMNILFVQRQIKKKREILLKNYFTKQQLETSLLQLLTHQEQRTLVQFISVFSDTSVWSASVRVRVRSLTCASVVFLFLSFEDGLVPALGEKKQPQLFLWPQCHITQNHTHAAHKQLFMFTQQTFTLYIFIKVIFSHSGFSRAKACWV